MLISDYLFNESKDIWQSYLKHPFLVKMGENTLDKEKFRKYLIQDFLYLKEYAKVYAMGLIKSDKIEKIKFILFILSNICFIFNTFYKFFNFSQRNNHKDNLP